MTEFPFSFAYREAQWSEIRAVVQRALGLDADRNERRITRTVGQSSITETQSLQSRIEDLADRHIPRSAIQSQTPGHKARIEQLNALRGRAEGLRDDLIDAIAPRFTMAGNHRVWMLPHDIDPFDQTERAIATLVSLIDASIAAQRPQATANSSKKGRDRFWTEALAIWLDIGGAETGVHAADFLIAVSKPVFGIVRADAGRKTMASVPLSRASVVEWLRLRAKAQCRKAS